MVARSWRDYDASFSSISKALDRPLYVEIVVWIHDHVGGGRSM
jgi:hypothetical protein